MTIAELFNREGVTDSEWEQALKDIEEQQTKQWADYLERSRHYDDAVYSDPYDSRYRTYVGKKGYGYVHSLTDLEGNIVNSKIVDGRYGKVWVINKDDGSVEWVNVSTASTFTKEQAHYRKKGYQIALCTVRVRTTKHGDVYFDWSDVKNVEVLKDE